LLQLGLVGLKFWLVD